MAEFQVGDYVRVGRLRGLNPETLVYATHTVRSGAVGRIIFISGRMRHGTFGISVSFAEFQPEIIGTVPFATDELCTVSPLEILARCSE